jgi:hypothetical protein
VYESSPARARAPHPHPLVSPESREHVDASCTTLARLAEYIPQWGMNKTAREVAATLCGYFDAEFRFHREEQESALFPALQSRAKGHEAASMERLIAKLKREHDTIESEWSSLREALSAISAARPVTLSAQAVARFANLYRRHLQSEESELMVLASRVMGLENGGQVPGPAV